MIAGAYHHPGYVWYCKTYERYGTAKRGDDGCQHSCYHEQDVAYHCRVYSEILSVILS